MSSSIANHPSRSAHSTTVVAGSASNHRAHHVSILRQTTRATPNHIPSNRIASVTMVSLRFTNSNLRQSSSFLSGKKKVTPWRKIAGEDELAKMRALTAILKQKNHEKFGKTSPPAKTMNSSNQTVADDAMQAAAPVDAKVVAETRRANRRARAVRELGSALDGYYWTRPSTRRAPIRP